MRALRNIATRFAVATIATGLLAGAAFGATGLTVRVTLPAAVRVGDSTIAGGAYEFTEIAQNVFVISTDQGEGVAIVAASKSADAAADQKSEVVLSPDEEGILHLDKMFVEGDPAGYQFGSK